jgi:glycerol-3-phosphate dehydrogenase (NAD(P)+)
MAGKFKITVLGDGGWGTALAVVGARKQNDVLLWSAFPDYAEVLREKRENTKFLPGVKLPPALEVTSDLKKALAFGDIVVLAIPTQFLRVVLHKVREHDYKGKVFVSVAKGLEKKTCLRPSQIIYSILGSETPLVVISGPSHAEEVARHMPTLVVAASDNKKNAEKVQDAFMDTFFRIYSQTDIIGVELGGALKNVIAIAAGVCDGLKFGDNSKAGLISRGILEMTRLGIRLGANPNTFFGLSGIGDLMTTCFSPHGRNLRVGRDLGAGRKIDEILKGMEMVAEGVDTAQSVHQLAAELELDLPLMGEVYSLVFEGKDPKKAVADLLNRDAREELKQY